MAKNKDDDSPLDRLLAAHPDKRRKPKDPEEALSRYSIENDRWDRRDFHRMLDQLPELPAARQKLVDTIAGEVGYDEAGDMYWKLWKVDPTSLPDEEIRPTRRINKMVNEQADDLLSYKELRRWTQGDDIGSALAFEKIEPDLEMLYDRMHEQLKAAQELAEKLQALAQAQADEKTAEQIFQEWLEGEEGDQEPGDPNSGEGQDMQAAVDEAGERVDKAQQELDGAETAFGDAMEAGKSTATEVLDRGFRKANEDFEDMAEMSNMWGMEPGDLHRLPAQKRLELAKKLDNEKFRRVAKIFGAMQRLATAEQKRKVVHSPEEIFGLELGNDPARLLPSELLKMDDEDLELMFMKDFVEKGLVQYEMKGKEKIAHGGIIYCHDGSGSMSGDREVWAKAIGLCLLHIARKQKRSFYAIQFGSAREIRIDDFRDTRNIDPDKVIDFAEFFFGGGTDFMSPLNHAIEILKRENAEFGALRSDIIFATDGWCGVTDEFKKEWAELRRKLEFKMYGILIDNPEGVHDMQIHPEPLKELSENRVATIKSIVTGNDAKDVFRGV